MTRLGLSESMRSTASVDGTEPIGRLTHLRPLLNLTEAPTLPRAAGKPSSEHETERKFSFCASLNLLRFILGGILAIVLFFTDFDVLPFPSGTRRSSTSQVGEQFDQLERSISLLLRGTVELTTTADNFLQRSQEVHAKAFARTEMLYNFSNRSFVEEAKVQAEEHSQVMRDALQYYAHQEQKILETKGRLDPMQVSLSMKSSVRPVRSIWYGDKREVTENGREMDATNAVTNFVNKNRHVGRTDDHRLHPKSTSVPMDVGEKCSNRQTSVKQPTLYRSVLFYVAVAFASAGYLWNTIVKTEEKKTESAKWSWSPVPKVLNELMKMLRAQVVRWFDGARRRIKSYRS
uniref:Transmembrane protein n=1 Tax=Peronospora matthiolae TaxID=2874970 RepID=A0AAV1T959_9STRA